MFNQYHTIYNSVLIKNYRYWIKLKLFLVQFMEMPLSNIYCTRQICHNQKLMPLNMKDTLSTNWIVCILWKMFRNLVWPEFHLIDNFFHISEDNDWWCKMNNSIKKKQVHEIHSKNNYGICNKETQWQSNMFRYPVKSLVHEKNNKTCR